MIYLQAILFGIVQGIGEFLPISSSGHLVLLHQLAPLSSINEVAFDITLHAATLVAVVWFFRSDIWRLVKGFFASVSGQQNPDGRLATMLLVATIPGGLAGFLWGDAIENRLREPYVVALMLVVVGFLFIVVEKKFRDGRPLAEIGWKDAVLVGFAQALALVPGTSRSGITIITGLASKLNREAAARFSFLLSIPIIAGAFVTKLPDLLAMDLTASDGLVLLAGFLAAMVSGWLAISFFLNFIKKRTLAAFAYYRFALALAVVWYFYL
jgi:undecaprenyl-diphosphatase